MARTSELAESETLQLADALPSFLRHQHPAHSGSPPNMPWQKIQLLPWCIQRRRKIFGHPISHGLRQGLYVQPELIKLLRCVGPIHQFLAL